MIKGRLDIISKILMDRGWKPNVDLSPTCPRCGSTNTKFCYYNNYSLTQPRYFCKGCRRYWTKGGSLRNVPVGGGCRKSRRCKLIRASVDGVTSRGLLGHCGGRGGLDSPMLPSSAGPLTGSDGPNIDLSLVYANFLNPKPSGPESQPGLEIPELPNFVGPSFQFSGIETMHMELGTSAQLAQESVFLECRDVSDRSSETHMSDGNPFYLGGIDSSFEKQNNLGDHHFTSSCLNEMNNFLLPPLPGEETAVVVSEGMVWPSPDLMCPSHNPVHATDHQSTGQLLPEVLQDSNHQLDESVISLFHIPNYDIFSGHDK